MNYGKLILELRKKNDLTLDELAEKSKVSKVQICRIEKGHVDGKQTTLNRIFDVLGVPLVVFQFLSLRAEDVPNQNKRIIWEELSPKMKGLLMEVFDLHELKNI